jgi:pimeloyl-ACP methyl ester carboxylesterase
MIPKSRLANVDGRDVSVYDYGAPDGAPVLTFHGVPSSGAGFAWADGSAKARGLRIMAPDRPGVGLSSRVDGWGVADYPPMVAALADTMGVGSFAVWGYSGGGPYAAACAASLADRVTRTAICAGMGDVGTFAVDDDFEKTDRQMLGYARTRPWLGRLIMGTVGRIARLSPKTAYRSFEKSLSPRDRQTVVRTGLEPDAVMAMFTQAFLRGAHGVMDDYRAVGRPWGIDLASIRSPVRIFHGDADTSVPLRHSEELSRRIPGSELIVWPGDGHVGAVRHVDQILDWLAGP